MNIEIGTKVFFKGDQDGRTVRNICVSEFGAPPEVYFDDGESASADNVFKHAEAWG